MNTFRHRGPAAAPLFTLLFALLAEFGGLTPAGRVAAQPSAAQQAEMLLNVARRAHAEANPQFAAERYKEFLAKFGGHKEAQSARLGLALALLDLPERNYQAALEAVLPAANDPQFPDQPLAQYYAAVCRRGLGQKELAEGVARPNEMPQRTQNAQAHFTEAGKLFAAARAGFEKKTPPDTDWAARSRADTAEMELRTGKHQEARATAEPFLKDAALAKSRFRPLGLYYHGFAAYLLGDLAAAGKSLSQLAPFDQPFGPHALYVLGRVHASQDEKAEAAAAFAAVLSGYENQKKAAQAALQQPDRFRNDPWEKGRLESLANGPAPDYVAGAAFYGACLNYEAGRFGEALARFQSFAKDFPASPLKDDATVRAGFCLVQTKAYDEAVKTLQPLTNHPRLGYQATFWLGKAHLGQAQGADPNNPNQRAALFATAITTLREAVNKANQAAGQGDPDAKTARAEMLLELADAQMLARQPRDAAQVYDQLANDKLLPGRAEELLYRAVDAYHLAGDLATSEARAAAFRQQFPNSPLLPLVLFRSAENSFARAENFLKDNKAHEAKLAYAEAATRYDELIRRFPDSERVNRARFGLALCHLAHGDPEKAAAALEAIPAPERNGDLATVPYVLADCLVRTAPTRADDALQDNMLREKLTHAAALLDGFISAHPKAEQTPDALLKLGLCHKRLATQLVPGNERNEALQKARGTFEKLMNDHRQSPLVGHAALERAKVIALQGDKGNAVNALRQFTGDPLQKSPVAPLAHVTLATLLREQSQAPAAADLMKQARDKFEAQLASDPARADWLPLLRYHHGVALLEANRVAEARSAFEAAVQAGGLKPIAAEAALKATLCSVLETKGKIEAAAKDKAKPNLKPEQVAALDNQIKSLRGELAQLGQQFLQRAEQYKAALPDSDARAGMLYQAAWAAREGLADPTPAYTRLLAEFPARALAVEARLELAELAADAGKTDDAIKLLKEAIEVEPTDRPTPQETLERIRLRLGAILFDKRDFPAALSQFEAVAANDKSPHRGQGLYRSAECLLALGKADEAVKKLVIFRDNGAFHNIPTVSDRALLRLGHALLQLKQWEAARQAFEVIPARYGNNNPWAIDARYGQGLALQNQNRLDEAVNAYAQVVQATLDERAGRARLQIGECRAKQGRWKDAAQEFQTVYLGYDIPELKFPALLEHARVLAEEKKPDEAAKLLKRVLSDAPKDSDWSKAAAERLEKLNKK